MSKHRDWKEECAILHEQVFKKQLVIEKLESRVFNLDLQNRLLNELFSYIDKKNNIIKVQIKDIETMMTKTANGHNYIGSGDSK